MKLKTLLEVIFSYYDQKPIYKNPTKKEIDEVADPENGIRFCIKNDDGSKDVFVWNPNILHSDIARRLNFPYPETTEYFWGEAIKDKDTGRWRCYSLSNSWYKLTMMKDWKNSYIDMGSFSNRKNLT